MAQPHHERSDRLRRGGGRVGDHKSRGEPIFYSEGRVTSDLTLT